jgi:hypothetical protein
MTPEKLLSYLLETAQDLLDTATYESQTHKAAVIVHWLAGLLESTAPDATPLLIAISDPETGEALEEITGTARLEIRIRLADSTELSGERLLVRG